MKPETLSVAMRRLAGDGFDHGLRAQSGRLHDVETGSDYEPEALEIHEVVRFEGESDPAEMVVLFALNSPEGEPLGTYSTVYGAAIPREDADVVRRLGWEG